MSKDPALGVGAPEQLHEEITTYIASRRLQPGDRLPTEAELSELFGVARSTTREALKRLEHDGLLYAIKGHGRFVSALGSLQVERPVTRYEGIADILANRGMEITTAVLSVEETPVAEPAASALGLEPGSLVIRVERLRYGDDRPMVYSVNTIPRALLPGPVSHRDWSTSINLALELHGHRVVSAATRISAVDLPESVQTRYALDGLGPWLLTEEQCLTSSGQRVLYSEDYHRGSEIAFNVIRRR
ncbi:GntR family transcriptional regulator [Microbacterium aurantiacum]|uniref:GntR family transcriptional regulator n=1 Tax=Microbacterium aurantiacum TaxID=162393 RepID=A0AAJ2LZ13_9MICO|nr:GntR family transcriptional regulator [Microbacterium aurantiacum]MDS0244869.1 GntR family transcriptional regulator [Microbacterium aurantiacum]